MSSIYTIGIGALDYNGVLIPFSEACAAVMVVAYAGWLKGIVSVITPFSAEIDPIPANHPQRRP